MIHHCQLIESMMDGWMVCNYSMLLINKIGNDLLIGIPCNSVREE